LIPVITAILLGVLSPIVTVLMCLETNKRLTSGHLEDIENKNLYKRTPVTVCLLAAVTGLSTAIGYTAGKETVSVIATVEVAACYLAVLAAAVIDLKTRTIPNTISLALLGIRLILFIFECIFTDQAVGYLVSSIIGGFLCALVLIIANKFSKGGIGGGDIKLLACVGFMCGLYVVFSTLLLALVACIIVSGILLVLKKCTAKDHMPFGPFIYIGYSIMCLLTLY